MTVELGANMLQRSVAARTTFAVIWIIGGKLVARGLDFVTLLVLARILTPADFGLVAMAMTVLFLVEAVLELPLAQALIRIQAPTPAMFSTAFTLGLCRAGAIACIMTAASWPMSVFYGEPRLLPLILVLALAPILRGLVSPRMVVFMQSLDFRREISLEVTAKAATVFVAIPVALATRSHWALAVGTVTTPLVMTALSYVLAPMRPQLTLSEWHRFRDMIGWTSASQFVSSINWQLDRILMGRITDIATFGRYAMANTLTDLPRQVLVEPLMRPLLAAFSPAISSGSLTVSYAQATAAIVLFAAPVFLCLGLLAIPMIRLSVGEKWLEAAPMLQWLMLAQLLSLPTVGMYSVAMSLDKARIMALRIFLEFLISVPSIVILALSFGIWGAIAARYIILGSSLVISLILVSRLIDLPIRDQLAHVWRPYAALVPMTLAIEWVNGAVPSDGTVVASLAHIFLAGAAGVTTYLVAVVALWKIQASPAGIEKSIAEKGAAFLAERRKGRGS